MKQCNCTCADVCPNNKIGIENKCMIVDLIELERVIRYFKAINNTPLDSIIWTRNGKLMIPSREDVKEYNFIGLSNKDFPAFVGWMPEDIGIRIKALWTTGRK